MSKVDSPWLSAFLVITILLGSMWCVDRVVLYSRSADHETHFSHLLRFPESDRERSL